MSNLFKARVLCPICWIILLLMAATVALKLNQPHSETPPSPAWLKYYILIGTFITCAWLGTSTPALVRSAADLGAKEPAPVVIGIFLFAGAPVILFPLMVSAWPLLSVCLVCRVSRRRLIQG
jgi:hypothetical protein